MAAVRKYSVGNYYSNLFLVIKVSYTADVLVYVFVLEEHIFVFSGRSSCRN